jgi:recombination protein RecT
MATTTTNTTGVITTSANSTAVSQKKKVTTIKDYVKLYEGEIARALPQVITPERFSRMVTTAITQTPKLAECTPQSFVGSMLTAAQLGLEPNTPLGQAYLIPYKNKGVMTCQFQLGYKGLIDLVHRSGEIKSIEARVVHKNDVFEYELGLEPKLVHKPAATDRGEAIWYYAIYHLKNGGYAFEVMSREDVEQHARKYSKSFGTGPWQTEFDEMAKKTVLKKVLKYAPLKTDFIRGDERVNNVSFEDNDTNIITEDFDTLDVIETDENGEVVTNEQV